MIITSKRVWQTVIVLIIGALLCLIFNPLPTPKGVAALHTAQSLQIFDRHGRVLRQTLSAQGGKRDFVKLADVSPQFITVLLTSEDRRFYFHPGVDVWAILRAGFGNFKSGKITSGASTITMQLARVIFNQKRGLTAKLKEALYALYLETALDKHELLEAYINNLPFGHEVYGVGEAAKTYFRKRPQDLSFAESAILTALIRSPSKFDIYQMDDELHRIKNQILTACEIYCDGDALLIKSAATEKVVVYAPQNKFLAPHFTDQIIQNGKTGKVITSLDLELQEKLEDIIAKQLDGLKTLRVSQAAGVVIDNGSGEILAYVGSKNYWDDTWQGMIDGATQMRQPGSALKPFTYGRALDVGIAPNHILPDVPVTYASEIGDYSPENYDKKFRGPVLLRNALANSLNVPAVELLKEIGVTELYLTLKNMEFFGLTEKPDFYGLGLTLGNAPVSLLELTRAYSIFARDGNFCELTFDKTDKLCVKKNVLSKRSAAIIRDFLSDKAARSLVFGPDNALSFDFPVMVKTGTSQGYKDNWTVAVTPQYTVGVWAGNFTGESMRGVSGVTGAAPIVHDVVEALYEKTPWRSFDDKTKPAKYRVCSLSGKTPTRFCRHTTDEFVERVDETACPMHELVSLDRRNQLLAGPSCGIFAIQKPVLNLPQAFREWQVLFSSDTLKPLLASPLCNAGGPSQANSVAINGFQIITPRDDAVYKIDRFRPSSAQYLSLVTTHPDVDFMIELDDRNLTNSEAQKIPLHVGSHRLKVSGSGFADEVSFVVR